MTAPRPCPTNLKRCCPSAAITGRICPLNCSRRMRGPRTRPPPKRAESAELLRERPQRALRIALDHFAMRDHDAAHVAQRGPRQQLVPKRRLLADQQRL